MFARIYKPSKTAMQSGKAKTDYWFLELEADKARSIDPLMGWTSGDEISSGEVRLKFSSRDEAIEYATKHGLGFQLIEPRQSKKSPKAYSDNFAFKRRKPWTH